MRTITKYLEELGDPTGSKDNADPTKDGLPLSGPTYLAKTTSNSPETNKYLEDLTKNLYAIFDRHLNDLIAELSKNLSKEIEAEMQKRTVSSKPNSQQLQSLPWLKHGVRGFLHKIWFGDHPENPNWQQAEHMTLETYSYFADKVEKSCDGIVSHIPLEINESSTLYGLIDEFKKRTKVDVLNYLRTAFQAGFTAAEKDVASISDEDSERIFLKKAKNDIEKQFQDSPGLKDKVDSWLNTTTHKIDSRRFSDAVNFMKHHGLNSSNSTHVRLIWPDHINKGIGQ